ncbi:MAG: hypothetical protein VB092_02290 [Oscillospiraceae bacterium]|nr:hypothetical protein [Oscillospiraceae bacterium]
MGKHYRKEILPKALEMKEQGYTYRMIGVELGYTYEQIKELMYRYNKSMRKPSTSIPAYRGRPRTRPLTTQEEYTARIKQLEMENDLLRSFLRAVGRR